MCALQCHKDVHRYNPICSVGLLLIHEKDYEGAIELFQHLSELEPGNMAVKQQLENLLKHVHQTKSPPTSRTKSPPTTRTSKPAGTSTKSRDHS